MYKVYLRMKSGFIRIFSMTAIFVFAMTFTASAATVMKQTDVAAASVGCKLVGLAGQYIVDAQNALALINEYRYEACQTGVRNPATGKALTPSDYVELKWSSDMEYIARIRAAESSLTLAHQRTNGKSCFAIKSTGGISSNCEVIAWNYSTTMTMGIMQWYAEKNAWVNKSGGVTGHYEAMINPNYKYVGLGTFYSTKVPYYNTTVGQFSASTKALKTTPDVAVPSVVQALEVTTTMYNRYKTAFTAVASATATQTASATPTIKLTKTAITLNTNASLNLKSYVTGLKSGDKIKSWSTSNSAVATVNGGTVKGKKAGKATIKVTTSQGASASFSVTVNAKIVKTTAITVKSKSITLKRGSKVSLGAQRKPTNSTQALSFSTANKAIATVDANGNVTGGTKVGTTTITVKSGVATVKVTVKVS